MKHDDEVSRGCRFICIWAAIFITGLFMASILSKPFGILIMISSVVILIVKLKADGETQRERKRNRKYQSYIYQEWVDALEDEGRRQND